MNELIKKGKKLFTAGVVLTTIVWSAGFGAFLPLTASAQNLAAGSLIKGSLPSVYYYAQDGKRYVFPNEQTYFTWYSNFNSVVTISDSELAAIPIGGNVTYRPGVKMVKITTDPKVYAVDANGTLRWVQTEALAVSLYGQNWSQMVNDVPDAFFTNYTIGEPIDDALDFSPASATAAATSIGANMGVAQQGSGELMASRASTTAQSKTVPELSSNVEYLTFTLKAGNKAVNVNGVTLRRNGVGTPADFSKVYLYEGVNRLADGKSVNTSTHEASFAGLGLMIPANSQKNITVVADHANINNDVSNYFTVTSIDADATVTGLPVSGNTMTVSAAVQAGTLTITRNGTIQNPDVGASQATVAKFSAEASSAEDVKLHRIALKVEGSVDEDKLANFKLFRGGTELATTASVNSQDLIVFQLASPLLIKEGEKVNFEVKADLLGQESGDQAFIYVKNNADVYAVGQDYGAGVQIDAIAYDNAAESSTFTLQGGDVTFSFVGPQAGDIGVDAEDAVFLKYNVTAARRATIQELGVTFTSTAVGADAGADSNDLINTDPAVDVANLTDIKIKLNGQTLFGPEELDVAGSDVAQDVTFTDDVVLEPGQTYTFEVTADVADNDDLATGPDRFAATLLLSGIDVVDDNDDTMSTIPASNSVGKNMTIVVAGVDISLASTPISDTYIKGQDLVEFVGFNFDATDTSDITVTELTITGYLDEDSDGNSDNEYEQGDDNGLDLRDTVEAVYLYDGNTGAKIAGPETLESLTGRAIFDSFTWIVPKGTTKKLVIKGDLANKDIENADADHVAFDIISSNDVEAEDDEGESVTATFAQDNPNSTDAGVAIDGANAKANVFTTIANAGTLDAVIDPSSPDAEVIVAGTTNVPVYAVQFFSTDEAYIVEDFLVTNGGSNNILNKLYASYKDANGTTKLAAGSITGANITFTGLDVYVPKDDDAIVTFLADLNSIPPAASALTLQLDLTHNASFEAKGQSSGELDIALTNVSTGDTQTVYKSEPTITLHASSPSGGSIPGNKEVLRFVVAADAKEDVDVRGFCFDVSSTDGAASDWNKAANIPVADLNLYKNNLTGTALDENGDWTEFANNDCTGAIGANVIESVLLDLTAGANGEVVVPKGGSTTFNLYIDTTGASTANDDSIRVDIVDIYWHDQAAVATINGAAVHTMPLFGNTLIY